MISHCPALPQISEVLSQLPSIHRQMSLKLSSLLRCHSLHARIQPALVAARGVLVQHALLYALIQNRRGLAILCGGRGMVALGDRLPKQTQRTPQLAFIRAVYRGLYHGLTCALQRRNMICHKLFLSTRTYCRGKWDAGLTKAEGPARPEFSRGPPQSLQYPSLRNSHLPVNHCPGKNITSGNGIRSLDPTMVSHPARNSSFAP